MIDFNPQHHIADCAVRLWPGTELVDSQLPPRIFARLIVLAPTSLISVALLVLMGMPGCSGLGSKDASLQPSDSGTGPGAMVRSMPVVPGRPARVFIFAGFGEKCEPLAPPQITITEPPAKGDVAFVPGQDTTIQYSAKGTCVGRKTTGTGVYYTARAGQEGPDRFSVSAKLPGDEPTSRTFELQIAE